MEIVELPIAILGEAPWNVNQIDEPMMQRLRVSIGKYGLVQNLVVRKVAMLMRFFRATIASSYYANLKLKRFPVQSSMWTMPKPGCWPRH